MVVTFPRPLPNDPVLIFLYGSSKTHKLEAERPNDRTVSVILPGRERERGRGEVKKGGTAAMRKEELTVYMYM